MYNTFKLSNQRVFYSMDQLSTVFLALADPTRRAILADLALGPKPVGEIASPFQMSEPGVIKHLKILERAGLVVTSRERQMRPRSLNAVPLEEAYAWVENYKRFWEPSFDQLEALLKQLQKEDKHESS